MDIKEVLGYLIQNQLDYWIGIQSLCSLFQINMSDYPQQFLDLADYLQIATELQNGDAAEKAASYWARWYWVKKAGEKYTSANSNDPAVWYMLSVSLLRLTSIFRRKFLLYSK